MLGEIVETEKKTFAKMHKINIIREGTIINEREIATSTGPL